MERGHDMTKSQKGTLCVFAAALLYSIGGLCIKLIPWGGMAINGSRTAIALVVIGAYLIWVKHPLRLNRWVALGAVSVFGCNALFSIANKLTTAANTIVLQFTAPIFVLLITLLFFHRRPDKLDVITCVVVFGGVVFFFLDSLEMGGGLGNVLALLSGLAYAGVFLLNDMPDSDAISSVFWGDVLSAITGLPFLVKETDFSPTAITSLLVLGVFQVAVAYILLTIGLKTTLLSRPAWFPELSRCSTPSLWRYSMGRKWAPWPSSGRLSSLAASSSTMSAGQKSKNQKKYKQMN